MVALPTIQEAASAVSPFALAHREVKAAGYSPLAIMPGTKRPGTFLQGRWCPAAGWTAFADSPASDVLLARWASAPDTGIGVALGSRVGDHIVICLDFDTLDPDELAALLATVPASPMTRIGSKGEARLYRADPSIVSRAYRIDNRGVLDLLAKGKQVVLPPTIHPEGMTYRYGEGCRLTNAEDLAILTADDLARLEEALRARGWAGGSDHAPASPEGAQNPPEGLGDDEQNIWRQTNNAGLANLDAWVGALGLPKARRLPNGSWEGMPFWRASNNNRPTSIRKPSLKFHRDGIRDMGADEGLSALDVVERAFCCSFDDAFSWLRGKLGLDAGEGLALETPRQLVQHDDGTLSDMDTGKIVDPPAHANDNSEFPDDLTRPAGLLGDLVDWIDGTARRPNRTLSLATAIVVLGTLIGRRDATPTRSGTHLYVLALARSGAGKQHCLDCAMRLLEAAGAGQHIASGDFMSQTALMNRIESEPLSLCLADEFGATMAKLNGMKAGDHVTGMKKLMRSAWGCSFVPIYSGEWANRKATKVNAPALSILGVSTPGEFFEAVQGGDIVNGALNRFLLISTGTRSADRDPPLPPAVLPQLADRLIGVYQLRRQNVGLLPELAIVEPFVVDWSDDDARNVYRSLVAECEARGDENHDLEPYFARTAEMALRLATICAVGRDPDDPSLSVADMAWGRAVAVWSAEKMAEDAGDFVGDTRTAADRAKVVRALKESPVGYLRERDLMRKGLKKKEVDELIGDLRTMGRIKTETVHPERGGHAYMIIKLTA